MLVKFDCYNCILTQAVKLSREMAEDDDKRRGLLYEMMEQIRKISHRSTPPEMASYFYGLYNRETGIDDPYREAKDKSTELGVRLLEEFRTRAEQAEDSFLTSLKFAIGGNAIDYGVHPNFDLDGAGDAIRSVGELPVDETAVRDLRERIARAKRVLYLLDNCGEAVLDRLLLEHFKEKVTLGVRGRPILNDVTRRELAASGLEGFPVIDTGDSAPGVSFRNSSPEFLAAMNNADLIIAKGQGNFESIEGNFSAAPIYFLFRAKCAVICNYLGVKADSLQIVGRNLS